MKVHHSWAALLVGLILVAPGATAAGRDFLPDTTVLVRVADRTVDVAEFIETYFQSWPEYRPAPDSLGRVQFLQQFVHREIMGGVAQRAYPTVTFEDRVVLRQWEERALGNVLYRRLVEDSVVVRREDVEALRREFGLEKRLQHIVFRDPATAKRVRADLVFNRISWGSAHQKHDLSRVAREGAPGWVTRASFDHATATRIFDLAPGQISEPFVDSSGVHLVMVLESRPTKLPEIAVLDGPLKRLISEPIRQRRHEHVYAQLKNQAGLTYDSINVALASAFFEPPPPTLGEQGQIRIQPLLVPKVPPGDTARVLARWKDGQISMGQFLAEYRKTQPLMRRPAHTLPEFCRRIDSYVLGPYKAALARELKLDRDPLTVKSVSKRREALLVEHLYTDSIQSQIRITIETAKKYYERHLTKYLTYPQVRYAAIQVPNQERGDSVAARLRSGVPPEVILSEDSLRYGQSVGGIENERFDEEGSRFHKILFEELRPGQVTIQIDDAGSLWVVNLLSFDAGRQLSYAEAEHYVWESLEGEVGQRLLDEFLARHKRGLRIETRPELVMQIDLFSTRETE